MNEPSAYEKKLQMVRQILKTPKFMSGTDDYRSLILTNIMANGVRQEDITAILNESAVQQNPTQLDPNYSITVFDTNSSNHYDTHELSLIHISEPTRRTPISYAVFCLKKK